MNPVRSFKLAVALVVLAVGSISGATAAIPRHAANVFTMLKGRLQTPGDLRLQVMRISSSTFSDPPPGVDSFESVAAVNLVLSLVEFQGDGLKVVSELEDATWTLQEHPGYARWCIRFIGPWNNAWITLLVDSDNSLVELDGRWYKLEPRVVADSTEGLLKRALAVGKSRG